MSVVAAIIVPVLVLVVLLLWMSTHTEGLRFDWTAKASRSVVIDARPDELLEAADAALRSLNLATIPEIRGSTVVAKTRADGKTFGSTVRIEVSSGGTTAATSLVTVSARPTLPQWRDWGSSRDLVDAVATYIDRELQPTK